MGTRVPMAGIIRDMSTPDPDPKTDHPPKRTFAEDLQAEPDAAVLRHHALQFLQRLEEREQTIRHQAKQVDLLNTQISQMAAEARATREAHDCQVDRILTEAADARAEMARRHQEMTSDDATYLRYLGAYSSTRFGAPARSEAITLQQWAATAIGTHDGRRKSSPRSRIELLSEVAELCLAIEPAPVEGQHQPD